jgi:Flp pilus assembly protein TadD
MPLALAVIAVGTIVSCDAPSPRPGPTTVDVAAAVDEVDAASAATSPTAPRASVIEMPPVTIAAASPSTTSSRSLLEQEALHSDVDGVFPRVVAEEHLRAGRADDAVLAFRKALARDASAEVWTGLGEAYLRAGNVAAGLACLQEAVAVDVDSLPARRLLVRHALAQRHGELARQHAEEWVRLEPTSPSSRQALGRAYSQLGMWKEAIAEFTLVVAEQPDNAYAHNNLGYAALQLGDHALAIAHLEPILTMRPQEGFMLNNLGVAYERAGRHAFAHAAFARAAELSPRYAHAALNRDRLQRGLAPAERLVSAETLAKLRAVDAEERGTSEPAADRTTTSSDKPDEVRRDSSR